MAKEPQIAGTSIRVSLDYLFLKKLATVARATMFLYRLGVRVYEPNIRVRAESSSLKPIWSLRNVCAASSAAPRHTNS